MSESVIVPKPWGSELIWAHTDSYVGKVLTIEAAFTVGWVIWFASIVAAVLYALGFAYFSLVMVSDLWQAVSGGSALWLPP